MTKLTSLSLSLLAGNLLVGCGDNGAAAPEFPQSCDEIADFDASAKDGFRELFVDADSTKPWRAYCTDMQSGDAKEYLVLPKGGDTTWSMYRAGGQAVGTDVVTRFDRVRIDPETLKLDIGDTTFAVSEGSLRHTNGVEITSMPLGVAMSCGGGYATANVDISGTPFELDARYTIAGAAATGHAERWDTRQVVEMWADGDCGWVAPDGAPAEPVNANGYLITLSYR